MNRHEIENKINNESANILNNRSSNNECNCSNCVRSRRKEKEFNELKNRDEYFTNRIKNYDIDDLVFDTNGSITSGDTLLWSNIEKELHDKYIKRFGMFSKYSLMLDYKDMGKDVDYNSELLKEDRANSYIIDYELVFQNAMSDNPKMDLMTDGEIKIYNILRKKHYLSPETRTKNIMIYNKIFADLFKKCNY